jgi:hypothetical protein
VQDPKLNGRPNIPYTEPVRARAGRAILRKEDMVVEVRDDIGTAGAMSVAGRWSKLGGVVCCRAREASGLHEPWILRLRVVWRLSCSVNGWKDALSERQN